MPPPPQLDAFAHRRYALVIDAGSSGSRLQIYSWRDPKSEKAELLAMLDVGSRKGKAKAAAEGGLLRRLPRVEKGVAGGSGDWQKKVEPGASPKALPTTDSEEADDAHPSSFRHLIPRQRSHLGQCNLCVPCTAA